jgi:FlgD Ig-like domain
MAPERRAAALLRALCLAFLFATCVTPLAHASRIVDWNILNYPGPSGPSRDPYFRTVLGPVGADVVVTEETTSQAGVNEFLTSVLNTLEPGQWAAPAFIDGNDTDCSLFYKPSKYQYLGEWAFYPNPANQLRYVHVYRLKPVGYTSDQAEFRIYALHLKASSGSANVAQRGAEAAGLRDSLNAMPPGTHALVMGDYNVYNTGSVEPAITNLVQSGANNIGQLYDPLGLDQVVPWQDNLALATVWTQSPCQTGATCASGAATGGIDDRFDLILASHPFGDGQGLDIIPGTYISIGNDGLHHNVAITDPPTIPEGAAYATALILTSDHLPQRIDIQWPSMMAVTGGPADFGTAIVGATAILGTVSVTNPATPPSDALDVTFTPPAGLSAPPLSVSAGGAASPTLHLDTFGVYSGNLAIASDAPDTPTASVAISGTVLRHAAASLDSESVTLAGTLDFGVHDPGAFTDLDQRVHDQGYDGLQARLALASAVVTGGDGHFTVTSGATPSLLAGTGETFTVHFDDGGATRDSLYEATLTFASGDEPLPGSLAQPDLVVDLRAKLTPGSITGVLASHAPAITQLYTPFPNPLHGSTTVRFDLARATSIRLEVFDLTGRRVHTIAEGGYPAGGYRLAWDGRDDNGAPVGSGLYYLRLSGDGIGRMTARLAVLR